MPSLERIFECAHHCISKPVHVINNCFPSVSVQQYEGCSLEVLEVTSQKQLQLWPRAGIGARRLGSPLPSDESLSTKSALALTKELNAVSMSEVKTMKKLASALSEEAILLEQHKSWISCFPCNTEAQAIPPLLLHPAPCRDGCVYPHTLAFYRPHLQTHIRA